ncbi:hypothetical protein U3516DRAFT_548781 [Neocallimastix sp. 'constans']
MSKSFEENTKDFYKELNGKCDPKRLLFIAEQGIFLKEPLFNYDKIKDHEFVVDISIINNQFFLINNDKQYNRLKYFYKEYRSIFNKYYPLNEEISNFQSLIIINKFFIDKLLNERDNEFLEEIIAKSEMNFYLKYLYNYMHIYTKNKNNMEEIIEEIIYQFGKDINILNYCLDKIKKYNLKIKDIKGYRVPMNHRYKTLKYYSDKLCIKNDLYLKCQDKFAEEFINTCFGDYYIKNFVYSTYTFNVLFSKKYNINFTKIESNFEIILKEPISAEKINNNKTKYNYDIQNELIHIFDPQYNGKLKYVDSYILIPGDINFDFVNIYLSSYRKIDRILKDPNYILNLNININNYTDCLIIKLCYLASLIHNNYSKFIIYVLIYHDQYWYSIIYRNNKIVFLGFTRYKKSYYIRKIFKILMNTPHKLFNSYFCCD